MFNLIETVKGYAKHESKIMNQVTSARKEFLKAQTIEEKAKKAKTDVPQDQ